MTQSPDVPTRAPTLQTGALSRLGLVRLLDADPSGVLIIGGANDILFANNRAAQLLAVNRDILRGADLRLFCSSTESYASLLTAIRRSSESASLELELRRVGAVNFRARVTWSETQFNDRPATLLWIEDISARRQAEEASAQLFDAAPLPMVFCSHPGGEVKRANRRAVELFIIGRKMTSCRLDDILGTETTRRFMRQLRDSGGYIDDFEAMLQTAYGEAFAGTISGQMITFNDERHILVGMNDITDRKKAEETLRRFFDAGPLAMLLARLDDTQVIRINRRASELFAADTGAEGGKREDHSLERYLGSNAASQFLSLLGDGGFVDSFEAQLTTDYGESFWSIISGQVVDIDHRRCVLVGITDITDRKRAEVEVAISRDQAQQATEAKSLFLAAMSHEIRTPMNGVLGMLDMLSRTAMTGEQREMVDVIGQSAASLLTIIDDILDLSKIEAGKLELEHIPIRLRHIVEVAVELVAARGRDRGLELAWWADPGLPDHFLADPVRLRQILLNLLSNAIKFTEIGHITVRLHGMGRQNDREMIRFEISDTGIGLTSEQRDRLFKAYAQAEASTTRNFGGTGLGLSICQKLTQMMGGEIGVISEVGVGSTFWFELPLALMADAPPIDSDELAGLSLLVVDDLPEARASIASSLRQAGAIVREVSDPTAAMELIQDGVPIDFAVVDLAECLPDLVEPLGAAIGLKNILPLTPIGLDVAAIWCSEQGVQPPLQKPARAATLVRAVGLAVGRITDDGAVEQPKTNRVQALSIEDAERVGRLILVAEDNAVNRLVIGKQLTELGHSFEMAVHGEAAWDMMQQRRYGLLLTDCFMPVLDGYELTRRLRRQESEAGQGARLPVVALTANVLEGEAEKCLAAEMDDYLSKPVFLDRLAATLNRWLPPLSEDLASRLLAPATPEPAPPAKTAVAEGPAAPPVDLAQFADIIGTDDPETTKEILIFFVETFAELLGNLQKAVQSGDRGSLRSVAHAAKGAARNACATALAEGLAIVEERALTEDAWPALAERITQAEQDFAAVRAMVESL